MYLHIYMNDDQLISLHLTRVYTKILASDVDNLFTKIVVMYVHIHIIIYVCLYIYTLLTTNLFICVCIYIGKRIRRRRPIY